MQPVSEHFLSRPMCHLHKVFVIAQSRVCVYIYMEQCSHARDYEEQCSHARDTDRKQKTPSLQIIDAELHGLQVLQAVFSSLPLYSSGATYLVHC